MNKTQNVSITRLVEFDVGSGYSNNSERISLVNYRNGTENVRFKDIILKRGNATTALQAQRQIGGYKTGRVTWDTAWPKKSNYETSGGITWSTVPITSGSSALLNAAVARANSKYFQKLSELRFSLSNGQEFLGEIKETLNFMRHPFKSGVDALTVFFTALSKNPAARKKLLRNQKMKQNPNSIFTRKSGSASGLETVEVAVDNATLLVKDLGSQWLEVRFGLLPLIKDLAEFSMMATTTARQERISSHRCFGVERFAPPDEFKVFARVYGVNHRYKITRESKAECSIRFGYLEKALTALEVRNAMVQETFGNLSMLPLTAWELLPMSCFVDYFVNVGEILHSALESQDSVPWISRSVILSDFTQYQEVACTPADASLKNFHVHGFTELVVNSRRVDRTTGPVGMSPMVFSIPSSPIRLANLAALLANFLH